MKIAINKCYGVFGLSEEAYKFLGLEWDGCGFKFNNDRTNENLIRCIEELGEKASWECANIKVIEIPDDIEFEIEEYEGIEWVSEKHRTWH